MIGNVAVFIVLVLLAGLFAWLTFRAVRSKSVIKWLGVGFAGMGTLVLVVLIVVGANGLVKLYAPRDFPVPKPKVKATPEEVALGKHIASVLCVTCHSTNGDLPLSGGKNLSDDVNLPLGGIYPPNLTPWSEIALWSDGEILRAIRQGTHKNGRPLTMPVQRLKNLADDDAAAVIAYLRSQPDIAKEIPANDPSFLFALFVGANLFNIDASSIEGTIVAPPKKPNADYGEYIMSYSDCRDCHGEKLDGRPSAPVPPGPNLRVVKGWTAEQFISTLRTGTNPSGHALKPPMPWKQIGRMDDMELKALYEYLRLLQ